MYDEYYQEYCNEVHRVIGCYLFWRMMQNRTVTEPELLKAFNNTPLSWLMTRYALQVTLFMSLGRIFDIDGNAFSANTLITCCIDEIEKFSSQELRNRKMQGQNGVKPDWLDQRIEESYEPMAEDFNKLRGELSKNRKIFEDVFQPVRHKLFAHRDKEYIGKEDELWKKTDIDKLEGILWFLNNLKETLFGAYQNGKKPILRNGEPDIDFYEKDYGKLFDSLKSEERG